MMIFKKINSNFKNENFQFFHFKFSWHISIFSVPSRGMAKCSIQISKSIVFLFSIPLGWYGYFFSKFKNKKLQFKFQKWNIQFCLFQISKMIIFKKFNSNFKNENFQFFYFKFSWHISIFFIPLTWYLAIPNGQMSNSNFKIVFSFFHFSRVVWLIFFQNSKTKNFNSNLKNEYSILFISNFKNDKNDNFQKKLIQISKMKIFNFFISNFRGIFQFFSFLWGGMAKCSIQISKSFFSFFHFSRVVWLSFFKKIQLKFQKWNIQFCLFQIPKMIKNDNFLKN
jgi:hypothetical protein